MTIRFLHKEIVSGIKMAKSAIWCVAALVMIDGRIVSDEEKVAIGRIADELCEKPNLK